MLAPMLYTRGPESLEPMRYTRGHESFGIRGIGRTNHGTSVEKHTALVAFAAVIGLVCSCVNRPAKHVDSPPATEQNQLSTDPMLSIETGTHTAPIRRIDVDRSGKILVTGSVDKTARTWDVA